MHTTDLARPLGVLLALLLPFGVLHAQDAPPEAKRTISVTGEGEVKAVPDRVLASFAVETTAARAADAGAENAKRSTAVMQALKAQLAADDTVTTTRYTLEPRYETPRPGEAREPRITGYVARSEVQVESRQVDKAGAFIDSAIGAGANRVGSLRFSLSQRNEQFGMALEKAGASAHAQAESAARGLGVRLKRVLTASVQPQAVVLPRRFEAMAAEARAPATPIEPGEATVSATLQVTYEIE
jgi:uncharacterized protein